MTYVEPPKHATALLKRLGPQNAALAGDLWERYQFGQSRRWYWGQVVQAILRANELHLVLRGVIVGWLTLYVLSRITAPFNRQVMGTWALDWLIVHLGSNPFVMWFAVTWSFPAEIVRYILAGWIVGKTHPSCRRIAVSGFLITVLLLSGIRTVELFKLHEKAYGPFDRFAVVTLACGALDPLVIIAGGWIANSSRRRREVA